MVQPAFTDKAGLLRIMRGVVKVEQIPESLIYDRPNSYPDSRTVDIGPPDSSHGKLWLPFQNQSGEDIPANSIMKMIGTANLRTGKNDEETILAMDKPDTWGSQYSHFINDNEAVVNGEFGVCCNASAYPVWVSYDAADGTPAYGEPWGPEDSSWVAHKNVGGFMVVGRADATAGTVLVMQNPLLRQLVKADADVTKGDTGTFSIHTGLSGSEQDTNKNFTDVDVRWADVTQDNFYDVVWRQEHQEWEVAVGEC